MCGRVRLVVVVSFMVENGRLVISRLRIAADMDVDVRGRG